MLHPYQTERGAKARAISLGRGATTTRARHGGWYAVGPVEIDADGRRDRRLYGINRREWWVTTELDAIRARGAAAPAGWSAIERELLSLLSHATPAELRAAERAWLAELNADEERRIEALMLADEEQRIRDDQAREELRARDEAARAARIEANRPRIAELRERAAALCRGSEITYVEEAAIELEIARLEEIASDEIEYLESQLKELEETAQREREEIAQREEELRLIHLDTRPGSVVQLPQHDRPRVVSWYDPDTLTVGVEFAGEIRAYHLRTGLRVNKESRS